MLFHVYGSNAVYQWIAMLAVLAALILLNVFSRRSKFGGLFMFGVLPAAVSLCYHMYKVVQFIVLFCWMFGNMARIVSVKL